MNDKPSEFKEGQWWVLELDNASRTGSDDFKRAVAVVHHLLRSVAEHCSPEDLPVKPEPPKGKTVREDPDFLGWVRGIFK